MGWFFEGWRTRKQLIRWLVRPYRHVTPSGHVIRHACLANCYRGCMFSGVLWSVWKKTVEKKGNVRTVRRWIMCHLLQYRTNSGWGVKYLDEKDGPCEYSCPLSYLKMAPTVDAEWRNLVREYHRRLKAKRAGLPGSSISISRHIRQREWRRFSDEMTAEAKTWSASSAGISAAPRRQTRQPPACKEH